MVGVYEKWTNTSTSNSKVFTCFRSVVGVLLLTDFLTVATGKIILFTVLLTHFLCHCSSVGALGYLYTDRVTCRNRNTFYWTVVSSFSLSVSLQLSLLCPSLMRVGGRIRTLSREALFQVTDHHPSSNSHTIWCHYRHRVPFFFFWVSHRSHATGTPALLSYDLMMLFHLTAG